MTLLRSLAAPLRFVVAAAIIARDVVVWAGGPLLRWLAGLRPLRLLAEWVSRLPRSGVLLALAAPVAVSEPLKWGGVYFFALGKAKLGALLTIFGHGLSILLVERLIHAGLPQLLTYGWFAWGWGWYEAIRAMMARWPLVVAARAAARRLAREARILARVLRRWAARLAGR